MPPGELCVVGDADQSIYAFRGATIRNIEDFERDYPDATTILLEQNYRSTQNILSAANSVISRNSGRRDKRLWTDAGEGELIVGYVADNEHDEARFVAEEIDALAANGDITYNDVAVFYRTNNSSRSLEEVFIRAGIPYKVVGGVRFYERREIRDIVAYLRVLDNPGDAVSMRRILNTPRRGIGDRAEACVAVYAENTGSSFADALEAAAEGKVPMLNTRSAKAIAGFVEMLDELRTGSPRRRRPRRSGRGGAGAHRIPRGAGVVLRPARPGPAGQPQRTRQRRTRIRHRSGQRRRARRRGPTTKTCRTPVCWRSSWNGCRWSPTPTKSRSTTAGLVTLMTLHTAKGLEFPVVFVTGWEDGMFPHMRALGDPAELSEERRLAYVGITRARQRLYRQPGQRPVVVGTADAQPGIAVPARDPAGAHRLAAHRPDAVVQRAGERRRPVRRTARRRRPARRRQQASAAGAGARRPGHPRQVRAGPGRRSLGRRRIGDVADRLRQFRAGQADAQPRPGGEALAALGLASSSQRLVCGAAASAPTLAIGSSGKVCTIQATRAPAMNTPTVGQHRDHRAGRRSGSGPAVGAAAAGSPRRSWPTRTPGRGTPTATQNRRSDRHQPAIRSVATTEVAQPLTMLTAAAATAVGPAGFTERSGAAGRWRGRAVARGRGARLPRDVRGAGVVDDRAAAVRSARAE